MNLKYIRLKNELCQFEVASILGVAKSTYCSWEKEYFTIPLRRLIDFCDYFNVSLDYALGLSEESHYYNMKKGMDKTIHTKRIKFLRRSTNYTQSELAKILNTDNGVISRYENGITLIQTSFLIQYAKLFNASCDYILGRIDEEIKIKPTVFN